MKEALIICQEGWEVGELVSGLAAGESYPGERKKKNHKNIQPPHLYATLSTKKERKAILKLEKYCFFYSVLHNVISVSGVEKETSGCVFQQRFVFSKDRVTSWDLETHTHTRVKRLRLYGIRGRKKKLEASKAI